MQYKDKSEFTDDWQKYEAGKEYNRKIKPINYYDNASLNWDFYNSYQYPGLEDVDTPKPVFNICNRIASFQVAFVTSKKIVPNITPMAKHDDDNLTMQEENVAEIANAQLKNLFDHYNFTHMMRLAALDGAVSGDYAMHIYFDPNEKPIGGMHNSLAEGEICMELVDGANIYLGNANNSIISKKTQPYVIIAGRDTVENLKKEAEMYGKKEQNIGINSDRDYEEQIGQGGKLEIEATEGTDKATYIIIYKYNEQGNVTVSKSTQNCYIYKDIDTGLKEYPVAWGVWEQQKNQYHGKASITGLIPNQIYINKSFALAMYYLMNNAFPKPVYNADRISGWTSEIDVALPVYDLQPGERVSDVATYLQSAAPNSQLLNVAEMAIKNTYETVGLSDAFMGNVNPENKGALIVAAQQASIPLENPKSYMRKWVNDIAVILVDMMAAKYGQRPIVMDVEGEKRYVDFDFSKLQDLMLNVSVQVGDGSFHNEITAIQTLDNWLTQGIIDQLEYFERIKDVNPDYATDIDGLIKTRKERMQMEQQAVEQQQMEQAMQQTAQPDYEAMADFVEALPTAEQERIMQLPEAQREQEVMAMMQGM